MIEKKKVLLIQPPFYRLMGSHFNGISPGLGYIASYVKKNGYDVKIYNADYENAEEYGNLRRIFGEYDNYKHILDDLLHPIWLEIREIIEIFSPDVVGITMLTGTYKSAENVAKIVKLLNQKTIVVAGGTHPTVLPEETIQKDCFDYVVRREGEITFLELLDELPLERITGLTYINEHGKIVNNPDRDFIKNLDELPFPGRELYLNSSEKMDYGYILTGRGCPFECTFCASKKIWKRTTRFRSPENVIEEIQYVKNRFGTDSFYFIDDTFTMNKKRAGIICGLIIENNLDIEWICDTRVDTIDRELLELMKRAGCIRIKLGVESGSERILNFTKKNISKDQIRNAVSLIRDVGIEYTVYLLIGIPTETNEEIMETLDFAEELDADYYSLSILAPYPGTEIYDDVIKQGIKLPQNHWEYFFHQSKDMILSDGIDESLVERCLLLNEKKLKVRL